MYNARAIAKYVIDYSNGSGKHISNLKLQSVLYFLQAEFLIATGSPCFSDRIEAWDVGPCVPNVYYDYSVFGAAFIPEMRNNTMYFIFHHEEIQPQHKEIINAMLDKLADYSAVTLAQITRNQTPWKNARACGRGSVISGTAIRAFFSESE